MPNSFPNRDVPHPEADPLNREMLTEPHQLPFADSSGDETPQGCCVWGNAWNQVKRNALVSGAVGLAIASLFVAAFFAGKSASLENQTSAKSAFTVPGMTLPTINATAAVTSEKFSMCTGPVSERSEALFVLDHNSGLLTCNVMYPRQAQFLGKFQVNVKEHLGSGAKGSSYMMTTGLVDVPQSSTRPVALSVVYVLDTTSGAYACFGIPFNRVMMNGGQLQNGVLFPIAAGNADPVLDRDQR